MGLRSRPTLHILSSSSAQLFPIMTKHHQIGDNWACLGIIGENADCLVIIGHFWLLLVIRRLVADYQRFYSKKQFTTSVAAIFRCGFK